MRLIFEKVVAKQTVCPIVYSDRVLAYMEYEATMVLYCFQP